MAIYSDSIGNHFLGDCIYGNHRIDYPTISHLQAFSHSALSSELNSLGTLSFGSKLYHVASQVNLDNFAQANPIPLIGWTPISDNECSNARFLICNKENTWGLGENNFTQYSHLSLHNNTGFNGSYSSLPVTPPNMLSNITVGGTTFSVLNTARHNIEGFLPPLLNPTVSRIEWAGVSDGESLGLFKYQVDLVNNRSRFFFRYQGILDQVNTNFNYYSANSLSNCIMFLGRSESGVTDRYENTGSSLEAIVAGSHYINGTPKLILATGDAQYPIVCADAQSPTPTWATDMYVFDNNPSLGYPAMGKVRNLLFAQGTFTIGKPVRISPSVYPDAGFNCWLPVGGFGGKTILMRCYSSVDL